MKCLSKDELINYFFSKDRSINRADMEAHFSICAACRAKMETLKQLEIAAASITPAPVSKDFTARLIREIKTQNRASEVTAMPVFKRLFRPAWGIALAAFAGALVLSTAYFAGRQNTPMGPAQTLYFSDGPATVNNDLSSPVKPAAEDAVPGKQKTEYIYTDNCATVKCGIL